jgi:hypothetical protein
MRNLPPEVSLSKQKANCVGEKVSDHIRDQISPVEIQTGQQDSSKTRDHEMRRAPAAEMSHGESGNRHQRCQPAMPREFGEALNYKTAIENFLEYGCAQNQGSMKKRRRP